MIIRQVTFLSLEISFYYITVISIYSFAPRFAMIYGKRVWCHVVGFNGRNRTLACARAGQFKFHIEDSVCVTFTICRNLYFSKYWKWGFLFTKSESQPLSHMTIRPRSVGRQLKKIFHVQRISNVKFNEWIHVQILSNQSPTQWSPLTSRIDICQRFTVLQDSVEIQLYSWFCFLEAIFLFVYIFIMNNGSC